MNNPLSTLLHKFRLATLPIDRFEKSSDRGGVGLPDSRSAKSARTHRLDGHLFLVHSALALALVGYNMVDILDAASPFTPGMAFLALFISGLAAIRIAIRFGDRHARWYLALLDVLMVLLAGLYSGYPSAPGVIHVLALSVILVASAGYADSVFSIVLGVVVVAILVVMRVVYPHASTLVLAGFLSAIAIAAYLMSRELSSQIVCTEDMRRSHAHAAMALAIEKARTERLEKGNDLRQSVLEILTQSDATNQEATDRSRSDREWLAALSRVLRLERGALRRRAVGLGDVFTALTESSPRHHLILNVDHLQVNVDPALLGAILRAMLIRARRDLKERQLVVARGGQDMHSVTISVDYPAYRFGSQSYLGVRPLRERRAVSSMEELECEIISFAAARMGGQYDLRRQGENGACATLQFPCPARRKSTLALPVLRTLLAQPVFT